MLDINFNFKSEDIPVTFEHEGKTYNGVLSWVPGAGGYTWHLSVNKYHWRQLNYVNDYQWAFYNHKDNMRYLADYFGDVVTAWYE